ncbi:MULTISPECIES: hypothetical protein [Bacillus]|uniref:hypothetical protein n=1 Tax=Bacillus TaxID=1386 RepID=UPI0007D06E32|nr:MULTISPECIES: hypothetical protein [Bacillus]MCW8787877.1 hypothetical protein [Bacillus velezensis]MED3231349.1 hypothetical protein [Bacillus velezensis]MED3509806.1 hypothetical protein [Bacillus velezensis]OAL92703.1 hypothetical protein AY609_00575 [Bacillus velezensis]OXS79522.1 hypothetical protein B1726_20105 [Bacillus sp. LYLB4]
MKRIQCLKDLNNLAGDISDDFLDYLSCEFYSLYEYLSNGEKLVNFLLPKYQNMLILEGEDEINNFMNHSLDLEFVEEVELNEATIIRMGKNIDEDIQLNYAMKKLKKEFIEFIRGIFYD